MPCAIATPNADEPHVQAGIPVCRDFKGETIQSRKCAACGYVRFPTPAARVLDEYYRTTYPETSAAWYNADADFAEWKRQTRAARVLETARAFGLERGVFHEVGCAFGGTVFELQSRGLKATGTDLNAAAVAAGRKRGADIHAVSDAEFLARQKQKPNVVFGFHMLEHVPSLVAYLAALRDHLARDAIAFFVVPNAMAAFPLVYHYVRYVWYGYPEHLHLLSPASAECLAEASGFELLRIGSLPYGIEPAATDRIALPLPGSPVAAALRDHALREALLCEELEFVLAPKGSAIARRHEAEAIGTKLRCDRAREFEKAVGEIAKTSAAPDPWAR